MKRFLALLLMMTLLLCAASSLADASGLTPAQIADLQRLAGTEDALWQEGTAPTASMSAFQLWQWTDWFLSHRVRSLRSALQVYEAQDGSFRPAQFVSDLKQLREMEATLASLEARLEDDRLAITNGLRLLEDEATGDADRQAALQRIREAEAEIPALAETLSRSSDDWAAAVDAIAGRLRDDYEGYLAVLRNSQSSTWLPTEAAENAADPGFHISVASTTQVRLRVCDPAGNAIRRAAVTLSNPQTGAMALQITDAQGDVRFLVGHLGADESGEMKLSLLVEATGYRSCAMEAVHLRAGETRTIELTPDNGDPYLISACFDGRDILNETATVYATSANTAKHTFTVLIHADTDGEVALRYPVDASGESIVTIAKPFSSASSDRTALTFEEPWLATLRPGTQISIVLTCGGQEYVTPARLVLQKPMVSAPVKTREALFSLLSGADSLRLSLPGSVPFLGGSAVNLDLPDPLPAVLYLPTGRVLAAQGYDFLPEQIAWQTRDAEEEAQLVKALEVRGKADEALATAGAYRRINTTVQSDLLGERGGTVTAFAALQGIWRQGSDTLSLRGTAGATVALRAAIPQLLTSGTAVLRAGLEAELATGFGLPVTSTLPFAVTGGTPAPGAPVIGVEADALAPLTLSLGVAGGTAVPDAVSVDLTGSGTLQAALRFTSAGARGEAALDMTLEATVRDMLDRWHDTLWSGRLTLSQSTPDVSVSPDTQTFPRDYSGAVMPLPPTSTDEQTGKEVLSPTTQQVFSKMDVAAGEPQVVEIGDQSYLFWIQPANDNNHPSRVNWQSLNDTSICGSVNVLNESQNGASNPMRDSGSVADYAFAVQAFEGDWCVLTILSARNNRLSTPQLNSWCVATVCLQRNATGGLDITQYEERQFPGTIAADILEQPTVSITQDGDTLHILSGYVTSDAPEKLNVVCYTFDTLVPTETKRPWTLVSTRELSFDDAAPIAHYAAAPGQMDSFYALNTEGALSLLSPAGRQVLVSGGVAGFLVQPGTPYEPERLFCLTEGLAADGGTTHRLQIVLPGASPVVTDYGVEVPATEFALMRHDRGIYLYWTQSAPSDTMPWQVRCVRYDTTADTAFGPFTFMALPERPLSLQMLNGFTGYYTTAAQQKAGSYRRCALYRLRCDLWASAELTAAVLTDPCVRAGDTADMVLTIRNTGNTPLSHLSVRIVDTATNTLVQQMEIDLTDPDNSGIATSAGQTITGPGVLRRIGNAADLLVPDAWTITGDTERQVRTDLLLPGDTFSFQTSLYIPATWKGGNTLQAQVTGVYGERLMYCEEAGDGLLLCGGLKGPGLTPMSPRPRLKDVWQLIDTDAHDLMLSAQLIQRGGEDSVHIAIRNRGGSTQTPVTPVLTASSGGETLFTHAFRSALGDGCGYSMDIPLATLTAGRELQEINLQVSGSGAAEFAPSDNEVRLLLTVPLYIAEQPESQTVPVTTAAAFQVGAIGGAKPYDYQWQRQTGPDQWAAIPGATEATYRIPAVTADMNGLTVRCTVTDQFGDTVLSDPAVLSVALFIARQPESLSVPVRTAAAFSVTADGGTTPYAYQWQRQTGPDQWEAIPGATEATYRIPAVTGDMNGLTVRCTITDATGATVTSNAATLSVNLYIAQHPANAAAPVGTEATFTVTADGGTVPYRYQWQRQTGTDWAPIPGATDTTYRIPAVTGDMNGLTVRCTITDATGATVTSNAATLSVNLYIAQHPANAAAPVGTEAAFSVTADGGVTPYTYQWQRQTGTEWAAIPGATDATYRIPAVSSDMNGLTVRCQVTDTTGTTATSNPATLTVLPPTVRLYVSRQPVSVTVPVGNEAAFSVTVTGGETPYTYQWQRQSGTAWADIPAATDATYRIPAVTADQNGLTVRCVVTDKFGDTVTSDPATLTVHLYIAQHPANAAAPVGTEAAFSVVANGGVTPYRHQWQRQSGTDWAAIPGATDATYRIPAVSSDQNALTVRCQVTDTTGATATSNPATLTVLPPTVRLYVSRQPVSVTVPVGNEAAFSVTVTGGELPYTYQWQRQSGTAWSDIPAATDATYRIPAVTADQNGLTVRCVVTDKFGDTVTSDPATLTVHLYISQHPANAAAPVGTEATFTVTADGGTVPYRYQWQRQTGTDWAPIPGATDATYRIPAVSSDMNALTVRCQVTDTAGATATSNPATLTVLPPTVRLYVSRQPVSVTVPVGNEAAFSVTVTGGELPYTYQWQRQSGTAWSDIPAATDATYRLPAVTADMNGLTVRCVVTDKFGDTVTSDPATLTVHLYIAQHPANAAAPVGTEATFTVTADGGTVPYRYQWQRQSGTDWAPIPGATDATYRIPAVSSDMNALTVRCQVTDTAGATATSNPATLTVLPPTVRLYVSRQPVSVTVPVGNEAAFSVTVTGGELPYTYQWQRQTGTAWADIPAATNPTYHLPAVTADQNGLTVRCVVTDQFGDTVTTAPATLNLLPETGDRAQPTLWFLLALGCVAVLTLTSRRKRRP